MGDIHGMFDLLVQLLDKVGFDTHRDRLISVGDLVDRGPDSMRAVEFLAKPWFHAIRGNHEDMLIRSVDDPDDVSNTLTWANNGGQWWLNTSKAQRERIYNAVKPLPIAMQVDTDIGPVGIVHADIPAGMTWSEFLEQIENGDSKAENTALWSRTRARMHKIAGEVTGIERIYCGHNIVDAPLLAGNVRYIDTGAFLPHGRITMVEFGLKEEKTHGLANK